MRDEKKSCATCKFWDMQKLGKAEAMWLKDDVRDMDASRYGACWGLCRIDAPCASSSKPNRAIWPLVNELDYCDKHETKFSSSMPPSPVATPSS